MNLLELKNRFKSPVNMDELAGYMNCMADITEFARVKSNSTPHAAYISATELTELISETSLAIGAILKREAALTAKEVESAIQKGVEV